MAQFLASEYHVLKTSTSRFRKLCYLFYTIAATGGARAGEMLAVGRAAGS